MAQSEKALITETSLTDAADAIREKLEVENTYLPSEMGPAIRSIKTMAVSANGNTLVLTGNGASSTGSGTEYDAISVNGQTRAIKDTTAREGLTGKVPTTRTINNKQLNANITLDANDIPYDDDPKAAFIVGSVASALFQRPQYNQVVRVDGEQSLTDAQKETARGNIGAASADDLDALDIDQRLLMKYIKGTRQTATYVNNETIETVHTDITTGNVIRRDIVTLNYSDSEGDGIMETRNLYSGSTITDHVSIFSNLTTLETRISA